MQATHQLPSGEGAGAITVDFGDALTIYTVDDQATKCREALRSGRGLTLELSRVATCDSLGIQLLCAVRRSAASDGKPVPLAQPSAEVQRAAAAIGCTAAVLSPDFP